jgi:hypothetical protein
MPIGFSWKNYQSVSTLQEESSITYSVINCSITSKFVQVGGGVHWQIGIARAIVSWVKSCSGLSS